MKVIYSGIGITNGSGKIGDTIASRNQYGPYHKQYAVPNQPNTPQQIANQMAFSAACDLWNELTDFEREQWAEYARRVQVKNPIGKKNFLAARNLFISRNYNLITASQLPIVLPLLAPKPCTITQLSITNLTTSAFNLSIFTSRGDTVVDDDYVVLIAATPSLRSTIYKQNQFYTIAGALTEGIDLIGLDFLPIYSPSFGLPVLGKAIFIKAQVVLLGNGYKTAPVWTRAIVQ